MSDINTLASTYGELIAGSYAAVLMRNRHTRRRPDGTTDAVDDESFGHEHVVIEQVTEIDDRAAAHHLREGLDVEGAKFLPFRGDHDAVGTRTGVPRRSAEFHAGDEPPGVPHALGIERAHRRAGFLQALDEGKSRSFAHVIRIGLERKAEDRHHAVLD